MTSPTPLRYDVWPTVIANLDMYLRFQLFECCPTIRRTESSSPANIDTLCFNLTSMTMGKTSFRLAARYRSIIVSKGKPKKLEFKIRPCSELEAMKQMVLKLFERFSKPLIVGKLTINFGVTLKNTYLPPTLRITSRSVKVTASGTDSSENVFNVIRRHLTPTSFPLENLQLDMLFKWIDDPIVGTAKNLKLTCNPYTLYDIKNHQVQAELLMRYIFNPITFIEAWKTEQAEVGRHFRLNGFSFGETRRVLDVIEKLPGVVKGTRKDISECSMFPECFTLEISDEKRLSVFSKQHQTEYEFICYEIHFKIAQILDDIV